MIVHLRAHLACAIASLLASASIASAQLVVTPLPPLGGDDEGEARAVSDDGKVAAGSSFSSISYSRPVRWLANGTAQALQLPAGYIAGSVSALSADGSVAVGSVETLSQVMPARWNAAGAVTVLPVIAGAIGGYVRSVSSDGNTLVGTCITDDPDMGLQKYHPSMWNSAGVVTEFGIAPGEYAGEFYGVNAGGSLEVGSTVNSTDFLHKPWRWATIGAITLLPTGGADEGEALDISSSGSVILGAVSTGNFTHACWWGFGLQLTLLPSLDPLSEFGSRAYSLSSDGGTAVGRSWDLDGVSYAVRWSLSANSIQRLPLAADGMDSRAFSVATNGSAIVGWMRRADLTRYAVKWAPAACPADINGDHAVSGPDLGLLLAAWSTAGANLPADLNHDGTVGAPDLAMMLAAWGACP